MEEFPYGPKCRHGGAGPQCEECCNSADPICEITGEDDCDLHVCGFTESVTFFCFVRRNVRCIG
jgi:hypothetical protein